MARYVRDVTILIVVAGTMALFWFFHWGPGSTSARSTADAESHREKWKGTLGSETPKATLAPLPRRSAETVSSSPAAMTSGASAVANGGTGVAGEASSATASPSVSSDREGSAAGTSTIHITTVFDGPIPAPKKLNKEADNFCAKSPGLDEEVLVDPKTSALANVFVRILHAPPEGRAQPSEIDQTGCMYRPRVVGLLAGSDLVIKSNDETTHNVHTYAGEESLFNRAQNKGQFLKRSDALKVKDGPVTFKCDIHPWMTGYVFVTDSPYFAVTDQSGSATIAAPPGHYTLQAWHEKYGYSTAEVTLTPGVTSDVQFRIGRTNQ